MPAVPLFLDTVQIEEIEEGRLYRSDVQTRLQRAFGGEVLAESLLAAYEALPDERMAHSLHAYFLRPGRIDSPVVYDVARIRDSRSFSSCHVTARQAGLDIFQMTTSFHISETGVSHQDAAPQVDRLPEDCPPLLNAMTDRVKDAASLLDDNSILDVRLVDYADAGQGQAPLNHSTHLRVWVRTRTALPDKQRWHQAALAYLSDITLLAASTFSHDDLVGVPIQMASIDHSMWFHRACRADQWLLYDQVSPSASNALGMSMGRIFQDGELVATCAQEGLIRARPDLLGA